MIDKPNSPLRQRMIEDMTARRYTEKVQKSYIRQIWRFAAFLGRSPDTATIEDVRLYQLHLAKQPFGAPTINLVLAVAVGSDAAGQSAGRIATEVVHSHGEAGVERENWAHGPTADYGVGHLIHVAAELPSLTYRQIVDGIGRQCLRRVVIAWRPFGLWIIDVLPIRAGGVGLAST